MPPVSFPVLTLLFVLGALAAVLNVFAGGGSMLTLPALIFVGLDPTVANGTNRVSIALQNLAATGGFSRWHGAELGESFKLALLTLPGAILGAWLGARISDTLFRYVLIGVLVLSTMTLFLPARRLGAGAPSAQRRWLIYPAMLATGLYGGFIQVGVGFLFMAALRGILKLDLVRVNVYKVFIVFLYTLPALAIFIALDKVAWGDGLALGAGGMVGALLATRLHLRGGERWVKVVLAIAILLMSAKLLWPGLGGG